MIHGRRRPDDRPGNRSIRGPHRNLNDQGSVAIARMGPNWSTLSPCSGVASHDAKVTVKDVWVATEDMIAYALVDAADPEAMAIATQPLEEYGDVCYRHVTSAKEL